jgi:hypothetical protein
MQRYARALLALLPISVLPNTTRDFSPTDAPRADGYVVTMSVNSDGPGMTGPMSMTLKAAGTKLRIEMDMSAMLGAASSNMGPMMNGAFMLFQDDGRMAMILPNMQNPLGGGMGMGMIMDMQSMTGGLREMGVSLEITDMKVTLEDLGAGETILGRKTKKYKLAQNYLMGGKPYSGESEIWTTTDMSDAEVGLKKFNETFAMNFIGAATSKEVKGEIQSKTPPGFPLRTIIRMTTPDGAQTVKMEVTKAEKASIDDKEFEVPAGMQLMDIGAMMKRGQS